MTVEQWPRSEGHIRICQFPQCLEDGDAHAKEGWATPWGAWPWSWAGGAPKRYTVPRRTLNLVGGRSWPFRQRCHRFLLDDELILPSLGWSQPLLLAAKTQKFLSSSGDMTKYIQTAQNKRFFVKVLWVILGQWLALLKLPPLSVCWFPSLTLGLLSSATTSGSQTLTVSSSFPGGS